MFEFVLDVPRVGGDLHFAKRGSELIGIEQPRGEKLAVHHKNPGEQFETREFEAPTLIEPVFHPPMLTAHFGDIDLEGVISLNLETGEQLYRSEPEAEFCVHDRRVYVARHGEPYVQDPSEFVELFLEEYPSAIVGVDDRIWVFGTFGRLHAYTLDGKRVSSHVVPWEGDIEATVVRGDRIYAALPNGSVYRFDVRTYELKRLFVGPSGPAEFNVTRDELVAIRAGSELSVFQNGALVRREESVDALVRGEQLAFVRGTKMYSANR